MSNIEASFLSTERLYQFLELNQRETDIFSKDVLVNGFTLHRVEVVDGYVTLMPLKSHAKPITAKNLHELLHRTMLEHNGVNRAHCVFTNFDRFKLDDENLTYARIVDDQVVLMTSAFASIEKAEHVQ